MKTQYLVAGGIGFSTAVVGAMVVCHTCSRPLEKVDEQEEDESDGFIGDAVNSVGRMFGLFVGLIIFLILVGIALAIYAANKTAESASNITFDEGAHRAERTIDIVGKGKDVWKR